MFQVNSDVRNGIFLLEVTGNLKEKVTAPSTVELVVEGEKNFKGNVIVY